MSNDSEKYFAGCMTGVVLTLLLLGLLTGIVGSCSKDSLVKDAIHNKVATYDKEGQLQWITPKLIKDPKEP